MGPFDYPQVESDANMYENDKEARAAIESAFRPYAQVKMSALYNLLGFKANKIPADYRGFSTENVPFRDGTSERMLVLVQPPSGRKHRIFLKCPLCKRPIPAGRLGQHIGRKPCQKIQHKA